MSGKSKSVCCWCCENFKVRFDNELIPNSIDGGICIEKRQECNPYNEVCKNFRINNFLIKNISYEKYYTSPENPFEKFLK